MWWIGGDRYRLMVIGGTRYRRWKCVWEFHLVLTELRPISSEDYTDI
jgi:hypothetical protein